jgi:phage gp36-like protein
MPYVTPDDFEAQSLPADAFAGLDEAQVTQALEWASRFADSFLSKRYKLPLVSYGDDLKSIVADLAQYKILSIRGFRPNSGNDEISVKRYDDAVAWLRELSRGHAELVGAIDQTPDVDEEGSLSSSGPKLNWSSARKHFPGRSKCGGCE